MLSGKYNRGIPGDSRLNLPGYEWLRDKLETAEGRRRLVAVEKLAAIARELGMSLSQLAIAWCLKKPQVSTVILGASRLEQLQENLGALAQTAKLVPEVVARIEAAAGA